MLILLLQQQYSILERSSEYEAFMVCHNEGLGVLPWSPLKRFVSYYSKRKRL